MSKIKKNRSDAEMFIGSKEVTTFENRAYEEVDISPTPSRQPVAKSLAEEFLTPELGEKIGKALLALKLKLYKEGIVEYHIKVTTENMQIMLTAVPAKVKK